MKIPAASALARSLAAYGGFTARRSSSLDEARRHPKNTAPRSEQH